MRIAVLKLRRVEQKSSRIQILDDFRRYTVLTFQIFSCNTGVACPLCFLCHHTVLIDQLQERKVIFSADLAVVLTECRSDMDDTGTICHRNVRVTHNIIRFFLQLCRVKSLILFILQIFSFISLKDLVRTLAKHGISQSLCQIVNVILFFHFYLYVRLIRVYAERHIGRKGPRCRRPCQEVCILTDYLETCCCRTLLDILISLCHLMAGKRGAAARAVRNDLVALVQQLLIPDLLQCPPLRLDKRVMIRNVRIIHVRPESDGRRKILPHSLVFPDALLAVLDKRLHAVLLDLLFTVKSKHLLYFQLYRQTMCIPSCLSRNHFPLHRLVTRDHILDDTRQHMADVRLSICSRRAVIEGIGFSFLAVLHTFFEDIIVFPELLDCLFMLYDIPVCKYFIVHRLPPL